MISVPGNLPPKTRKAAQLPITGMDWMIASAIRSPVPESRSSGREYPAKPSTRPSVISPSPISQFSSRGLRKAPVKNTRNMCTVIEAMNSSAAQWWIWRITRPPRTSKEMCRVEA